MATKAFALAVGVFLLVAGTNAEGQTVQVGPNNTLTFSPSTQPIGPGDTVHWVWAPSLSHTTTSGTCSGSVCTPDGRWDSGAHSAPFTFDVAFPSVGAYPYYCAVHGAAMQGVIDVSTFGDVPPSHPFFTWIEALYRAGITGGCNTTPLLYCPDAHVTRAQMAVFLLRGIHGAAYQPPAATGTTFNDVPSDNVFAPWIEELAREGITGGCSTSPPQYCPNNDVTRGQMAVFLLRAEHGADYDPPPATGTMFGDVPSNHPFAKWIEQLAREGITGGCGSAMYCPDATVTRGQMAVFLVRTFNLPLS